MHLADVNEASVVFRKYYVYNWIGGDEIGCKNSGDRQSGNTACIDSKSQCKRHFLRCIILRLCVPQFVVFSFAVSKEFFMTSDLNYIAFMKYSNFVAEVA